MTPELTTLQVPNRQQWRKWLANHHASSPGVWLVFYKNHTLVESLPYEDSVREALCFGWIDSLVKRLDDDRYARKFTPRQPTSRWSTINRRRYADLQARGLLAAPGLERAPTSRTVSRSISMNSLAISTVSGIGEKTRHIYASLCRMIHK